MLAEVVQLDLKIANAHRVLIERSFILAESVTPPRHRLLLHSKLREIEAFISAASQMLGVVRDPAATTFNCSAHQRTLAVL
jgi:hypothetical protein